ncbi:MAG: hypothetical protein FIB00_14005 [Chloroflexi bacterium]|nr:hypothetical protein [Chloroflexota bacterium]
MGATRIPMAAATAWFVGGCAATSGLYDGYSVTDLKADGESTYAKLVSALQNNQPPLLEKRCFQVPISEGDKTTCTQQRNSAVAALVLESEALCVAHRRSMYGKEASFNIIAGTFTNAFAGAAAVTPDAATKSLLSALALFSSSERSLVNETVYKQVMVSAVDKKITQVREARARELYAAFAKPMDSYVANMAIHDVISFHYGCSFMEGLRLALEEGTQETPRQKAARLRSTLQLIGTEMDTFVRANTLSEGQKAQFDKMKERYNAVAEELKLLEKQ